MRKRSKAVITVLALCVAFCCVNLAVAQIRTGGYKEISRDNAEVEAARTLSAWAEFDLQNGNVNEGNKKLDEARAIFRRLGTLVPDESYLPAQTV